MNDLDHELTRERRLLELETKIQTLEDKIDTLSTNISDLVSAWKAASWLVNVVKVVGGVATACAAIAVFLKGIK